MNVHFGRCGYGLALQEHTDGVRIFFRHVALNTVLLQLRNGYLLKGAKPRLPGLRTASGGGLDGQGILTFTMTGHTPVRKVYYFTFFIIMHLVTGNASHITL